MPVPASAPTPILARDPSIVDCLTRHGFAEVGPARFSNGRAVVRFEGATMFAESAQPTRIWRSDLREISPASVVALLDHLLPTPGFMSAAELEQQTLRVHAAKIALDLIVEVIREAPETPTGRGLSQLLWSLFNMHHVINLWSLKDTLSRQQAGWATEVFTAWFNGHVSDELLRRALNDSGEMERQHDIPPASGPWGAPATP